MKKISIAIVGLPLVMGLCWLVRAGDLEPPGPPAPTMTRLDELRCTPIRTADLPYTITEPGEYCVAEDLVFEVDDPAITIDSGGVSLDLQGFTMSRTWGNDPLVTTTAGLRSVTVKNGAFVEGKVVVGGTYARVENIRVDCPECLTGLAVGDYATVVNCAVRGHNAMEDALIAGDHCRISNCDVFAEVSGVRAGSHNIIENNIANGYNGAGILVYGSHNMILRNVAQGDSEGIEVNGDNNVVMHNRAWGPFWCYDVDGNNNRVEGNQTLGGLGGTDVGFRVSGDGNLIIRNAVLISAWDFAYEISGTNQIGPIGTLASSDSPWLNIAPAP